MTVIPSNCNKELVTQKFFNVGNTPSKITGNNVVQGATEIDCDLI